MGLRLLLCLFLLSPLLVFGQAAGKPPYYDEFQSAYKEHPDIPRGILEAVAYTNTHIRHITHDNEEESCNGMPFRYGVMGLVEDGKEVFRENLDWVSNWTGYSANEIKTDPKINIMASAKALNHIPAHGPHHSPPQLEDYFVALLSFSEFEIIVDPETGEELQDYVANVWLYSICTFLNDPTQQARYNFPDHHLDLRKIFGDNYDILSAPHVLITPNNISANDHTWQRSSLSADYQPAIWNAAASCNYSSRAGVAVSAVTIHTIQGSYASCISWFQNCAANVSAHYVIRSSDGQVTQMVSEADKAWHVGSENPYTIGIEHEGFINDPSWYTPAMYQSSANLVKDITRSGYGINPLSCYKGSAQIELNSCYRIKGHVHYPNQSHTDPGTNWNWPYYYSLINDTLATTNLTACSGTLTDNGGSGNYQDLTKFTTVIAPPGALEISMAFNSFSLEAGYDSLYIYDGNNINAPLIGGYTGTNSPGTITAASGKITLLFTSDCSVNSWGYSASWQCTTCPGNLAVNATSSPVDCYGTSTGSALVTVSGGATPYQYQWQGGGTAATKNNLSAGSYRVTVTDANGCSLTDTTMVTEPPALQLSLTAIDPSCFNSVDGSITATVTGGTGAYQYYWSNGRTTPVDDVLPAGPYSLTVVDANSCSVSAADTLVAPPMLVVSLVVDDVSCNGGNDGIITSTVTGGTPGYTYDWNDGSSSLDATNLTAGSYSLTVEDAHGCTVSAADTIMEPTPLLATFTLTHPTCAIVPDGGIAVVVSGGIPDYDIFWSDGDTNMVRTALTAGNYTATIIDQNGCSFVDTVELLSPVNMAVAIDSLHGIDCFGQTTGSLAAIITGGQSPYTYIWSNGATNDTANQLAAGTYALTVADINNCRSTDAYILAQPGLLEAGPIDTIDVTCYGGNDGEVRIKSLAGGTPPYNYLWSNGNTSAVNTALNAGYYTVTGTDSRGCTVTAGAVVNEPLPLAVAGVLVNGNQAAITGITGGISPYLVNWCNGDTGLVANLPAGICNAAITDFNGCELDFEVEIIPTGVADISDAIALLVTNPAHNICRVQLSLPAEETFQLQLVDMQGRVLQKHSFKSSQLDMNLDTRMYARGMYIVNVFLRTRLLSEKVVLE